MTQGTQDIAKRYEESDGDDDDDILTINTLVKPKKTIKIDGSRYDMLSYPDFGIKERAFLMRVGRKMDKLAKFDVTDEEADQIGKQVKEYVNRIVPTLKRENPRAFEALLYNDCEKIINRFLATMPKENVEDKQPTSEEVERVERFLAQRNDPNILEGVVTRVLDKKQTSGVYSLDYSDSTGS